MVVEVRVVMGRGHTCADRSSRVRSAAQHRARRVCVGRWHRATAAALAAQAAVAVVVRDRGAGEAPRRPARHGRRRLQRCTAVGWRISVLGGGREEQLDWPPDKQHARTQRACAAAAEKTPGHATPAAERHRALKELADELELSACLAVIATRGGFGEACCCCCSQRRQLAVVTQRSAQQTGAHAS